MPATRRTIRVVASAVAALIFVGLASAGIARAFPAVPRLAKAGTVYTVEHGTHSYTFDAFWRVERTWTRGSAKDSRSPAPAAAPWLEEFRGILLRHRGVPSLDGIPAEGADDKSAIRALGYI